MIPPTDDLHPASELAKELQASQTLYQISQLLAGTVDLEVTLQNIAEAANDLIHAATRTTLHLLDESRSSLRAAAVSGSDLPTVLHPLNFKLGEGVAGMVLATGETINVQDVQTDPRYIRGRYIEEYPPEEGDTPRERARSLLVAPVKTDDKLLGTLSVQSNTPHAFTQHDERLLTRLGVQAAVAIEKAKLYADLQAALAHEKTTRAQLVQSEKLAALGRIVASVAHELNNPLQAIQNALYLIKLEQNLSPQAREDLQTVLNEADRMADLISRLRETYRPARSEEFALASINDIVNETHRLISTHLRRSQISFEAWLDPDVPQAPLIRDQIKQVLLNICLNAVEAMPEGGSIIVRTDLDDQTEMVVLSIANTGPGIDPEVLPNIFDPFTTTKEGGTGLGLAISYDIIQRHGGRISVTSEARDGVRFDILLPLVQVFGKDEQKNPSSTRVGQP